MHTDILHIYVCKEKKNIYKKENTENSSGIQCQLATSRTSHVSQHELKLLDDISFAFVFSDSSNVFFCMPSTYCFLLSCFEGIVQDRAHGKQFSKVAKFETEIKKTYVRAESEIDPLFFVSFHFVPPWLPKSAVPFVNFIFFVLTARTDSWFKAIFVYNRATLSHFCTHAHEDAATEVACAAAVIQFVWVLDCLLYSCREEYIIICTFDPLYLFTRYCNHFTCPEVRQCFLRVHERAVSVGDVASL